MRRSKWIIIIIGLGVLIGSGWWLLGHATTQKAQQVKQTENEQPTFYLHGYGGSARSTDSMIKAAREQKNATQVLTATVRKDGSVDLQGRWLAKTTRPIVQVVFEDNRNPNYQQDGEWFKNVLVAVNRQHSFKRFNVVAHSMGNLTAVYYLLNHATDKQLPRMAKMVNIAGHFDGIIGMDDQPNQNQVKKDGQPQKMNATYRQLMGLRNQLPAKSIAVLNIYGDLGDGTHSDGRVSNASSQSLRYLVTPGAKTYQEKKFTGKKAQHSQLHENHAVNQTVLAFLW